MTQKRQSKPGSAEKTVRDIRRATRRQYSAEEKIRIVLEDLLCGFPDIGPCLGNDGLC
jgi:transposase